MMMKKMKFDPKGEYSKLFAVKLIKEHLGIGLKEAKDVVDGVNHIDETDAEDLELLLNNSGIPCKFEEVKTLGDVEALKQMKQALQSQPFDPCDRCSRPTCYKCVHLDEE